ncbi:MAG: GNAT family N-acetyltransferase [Burkholderiales bacterium]|nr:GNAT family N-acetyltransferase [Burkholderiales bacterium]
MLIRRLVPTDAAAFHALRLQALMEAPTAFGASYEDERHTPLSMIEARLTADSGRNMFGAFVDDRLLAMVGIGCGTGLKEVHKGFVRSMYVAPAQRGQGTGRAILEHAIGFARTLPGVRQLTLAVNATNTPAIALYESLGFASYGLEPDSLLVDGVFHSEMLMFRLL